MHYGCVQWDSRVHRRHGQRHRHTRSELGASVRSTKQCKVTRTLVNTLELKRMFFWVFTTFIKAWNSLWHDLFNALISACRVSWHPVSGLSCTTILLIPNELNKPLTLNITLQHIYLLVHLDRDSTQNMIPAKKKQADKIRIVHRKYIQSIVYANSQEAKNIFEYTYIIKYIYIYILRSLSPWHHIDGGNTKMNQIN